MGLLPVLSLCASSALIFTSDITPTIYAESSVEKTFSVVSQIIWSTISIQKELCM